MIIVEEHLGLARKIAFQFYRNSKSKYSYDEIESTAFLGLIEAANNFDESRGFKFSTYAIPVITGRVKRMFRDDKWYFIRRGVPHEMRSLNFIIDTENNVELQDILEDEVNIEENVTNEITVKKLLASLTERDRNIVYLYYFKRLKQMEIAEIMNITQLSVSRIIKKSFEKMKEESAS